VTTTAPQFINVPKDGNPVIIATDQIVNVFVDRENRTVIALQGDKFSHTDALAEEVSDALLAYVVETEAV
jgi:hypothetical protein